MNELKKLSPERQLLVDEWASQINSGENHVSVDIVPVGRGAAIQDGGRKSFNLPWLAIVAQKTPISRIQLFILFIERNYFARTPANRNWLNSALDCLFHQKHIERIKGEKGFLFYYSDDCRLKQVTGLQFSKALDCGEW